MAALTLVAGLLLLFLAASGRMTLVWAAIVGKATGSSGGAAGGGGSSGAS